MDYLKKIKPNILERNQGQKYFFIIRIKFYAKQNMHMLKHIQIVANIYKICKIVLYIILRNKLQIFMFIFR